MEIETIQFLFHPSRREAFQKGDLTKRWYERYKGTLFDKDDLRLTQTRPNRHFYEWLAAILIYESTGFRSLIEKYTSKNHPRKRETLERVVGSALFVELIARQSGLPDLFVYSADEAEWFLAEVKGDKDSLRGDRRARLEDLAMRLGPTRVRIIKLKVLRVSQ